MKKYKTTILIVLVSLINSSCANIFYGESDKMRFESNPQGADVYINGIHTNKKTPCEINVVKEKYQTKFINNQLTYELIKSGYAPSRNFILAKTHPLVWLDFVALVPGYVDIFARRAYKYNTTIKENLVLYPTETKYVFVDSKNINYTFEKKTDVDNFIPIADKIEEQRFALIIGNEDYSSYQRSLSSEQNVDFARNDASAFHEYANKTLGIPESNIIFLLDATTSQINQSLNKLNLIIKTTKGNSEIFFYYAGHGLPDEQTKDAYIIPVDVNGSNPNEGVKLNDIYKKLTEYPSKRITVFLDACFSGGARNQNLNLTRGVKIKPKEALLNGNIIIFSSSTGEQSSNSYNEKNHGLFTYFLLKKIKESKGNINYNDLFEYLSEKVPLQSILVNNKEQNPQISFSKDLNESWGKTKLK
ncbi:MAG TPA: caspase family protein [Tenuifilaceae bacterium]|nr:caspase family protein [Tenuifilaceae bacterium]